jgi:hypothetical protein
MRKRELREMFAIFIEAPIRNRWPSGGATHL